MHILHYFVTAFKYYTISSPTSNISLFLYHLQIIDDYLLRRPNIKVKIKLPIAHSLILAQNLPQDLHVPRELVLG